MTETRFNILLGIGVIALSFGLLIVGLGHPSVMVYDETHYVPAARRVLELSFNSNVEHPLFAKSMIAAGIALFGDTPFGWRFFGVVITSVAIFGLYEITRRLTENRVLSGLTALLCLTSITATIQARNAMLDTYAYPLLIIATFLLIWSTQRDRTKTLAILALIASGIFLGFAAGSKWIAGIYAFMGLIALFAMRGFETFKSNRPVKDVFVGRNFSTLPEFSFLTAALLLGLPSLVSYFATFWPIFFWETDPVSLFGVFEFQLTMLDRQTSPLSENPFESEWWQWPVQTNPIWYHFETNEAGNHEVLFYLGNPIIYWGGLLAVAALLLIGAKRRSKLALFTALAFLASWMIFAVLPKQIGFQFYYHGSAMLLCVAIPIALSFIQKKKIRLIAALGVAVTSTALFLYFLPVTYALEMPPHQWTQYVWFESWR